MASATAPAPPTIAYSHSRSHTYIPPTAAAAANNNNNNNNNKEGEELEELEEAPPTYIRSRSRRYKWIIGLLYHLVAVLKKLLKDKNKE